MTEQCPKTCKRCNEVPPSSGGCVDHINPETKKSDCQERKEQCKDPMYLTVMKGVETRGTAQTGWNKWGLGMNKWKMSLTPWVHVI
nr:Metridin ShK toxin domain containing protein [Haemonchus contortus]